MRKVDIIAGVLLCLLSLALIFVIIPAEYEDAQWTGLSPYFFPIVLSAAIAIASIILVLRAVLQPADYPGLGNPVSLRNLAMLCIVTLLLVAGSLAFAFLGIWIGGPALIAGLMIFMGERNPLILVLTSSIPVVIVYVVVTYVLNSPLP